MAPAGPTISAQVWSARTVMSSDTGGRPLAARAGAAMIDMGSLRRAKTRCNASNRGEILTFYPNGGLDMLATSNVCAAGQDFARRGGGAECRARRISRLPPRRAR